MTQGQEEACRRDIGKLGREIRTLAAAVAHLNTEVASLRKSVGSCNDPLAQTHKGEAEKGVVEPAAAPGRDARLGTPEPDPVDSSTGEEEQESPEEQQPRREGAGWQHLVAAALGFSEIKRAADWATGVQLLPEDAANVQSLSVDPAASITSTASAHTAFHTAKRAAEREAAQLKADGAGRDDGAVTAARRAAAAARAAARAVRNTLTWRCVRCKGAECGETEFVDFQDDAFKGMVKQDTDLQSQLLNSYRHVMGSAPCAFRSRSEQKLHGRSRKPKSKETQKKQGGPSGSAARAEQAPAGAPAAASGERPPPTCGNGPWPPPLSCPIVGGVPATWPTGHSACAFGSGTGRTSTAAAAQRATERGGAANGGKPAPYGNGGSTSAAFTQSMTSATRSSFADMPMHVDLLELVTAGAPASSKEDFRGGSSNDQLRIPDTVEAACERVLRDSLQKELRHISEQVDARFGEQMKELERQGNRLQAILSDCQLKASKPWHLAQGGVRRQKPQRYP